MNLYTTLKTLCLVPSVSGREEGIRNKLREMVTPFVDEVRVDNLGNLIATKKGKIKGGVKTMLCAHMDEIGFLVTFIEENGMLRIAPVGGINFVACAYEKLISEKGVAGVLVPEGKTKAADYGAGNFYIDIGAKSGKEAQRRVAVGDFFVAEPTLTKLGGTRVCGRPLDDRVGCAALLGIAEELASVETDGDVYYVFSVQEEVGCRGAMTASYGVAPDYSLCFDVTGTGDTIGASPMACKVGGGAAVKIKDSSVICNDEVVKELCRLAEAEKIPYQKEILLYGGTDTSAMQLVGNGSKAGALSIPTRYIHSPNELCDLDDVKACISLAVAFIKGLR